MARCGGSLLALPSPSVRESRWASLRKDLEGKKVRRLFLAGVCLVLLVLGLVLESLSMLLVMMPVLYPSVLALDLDPIWFGIFFVIMIECAPITPPLGLNLFVIQSVSRDRLGDIVTGVWPFALLMLLVVVLISVFPSVALHIPFRP